MHESQFLNFRIIPDHIRLVNLFNCLGSKIIALIHVIHINFPHPPHSYLLLGRYINQVTGIYMIHCLYAHHIVELFKG